MTDYSPLTRPGNTVLENAPAPAGTMKNRTSMLLGSLLTIYGAKRRGYMGLFLAGIGASMVYRGLDANNFVGKDGLKRLLLNAGATQDVSLESSITVYRPITEVYSYWRTLENFPNFMAFIERVTALDDRLSHWVIRVPKVAETIEFDARIIEERPNELLVWRSDKDADIFHEGFLVFHELPNNRGTEMHIRLVFRPPAGGIGNTVAQFLKMIPEQILKEDLRRAKQLIETGELPTIYGQPSAQHLGSGLHKKLSSLEQLTQPTPSKPYSDDGDSSSEQPTPTIH